MSGNPDDVDDQNVIIDFTPVCWYGIACYRKNREHFRKYRHPHLQSDSRNEVKESVEIKLEIGHDATLKDIGHDATTSLGHTHDWTAFVRCTNQYATGFFLEKVEFSFPQAIARPPIVVNQPPFNVTESGSRSFVLNIDISFKSRDPKRTRIDYDLYLKYNASFSNVQLVKLIIQNPPSDFRQRLLLAGGVMVHVPGSSSLYNIQQLQPSTSLLTNKRKVGDSTTTHIANDDCDTFGQLCTSKLRKLETLSPPQKTLAEKLISEVLFHAEQKSLTNDSRVQLTNQSQTVNDSSPLRAVKTEQQEAASSTSSTVLQQVIKSEDDSPSSSTQLAIQSEDNSQSSSAQQAIKSEVDSPASSSDIEDCVFLQIFKPEPIIMEIKEEVE